jgi:hypothetical protein
MFSCSEAVAPTKYYVSVKAFSLVTLIFYETWNPLQELEKNPLLTPDEFRRSQHIYSAETHYISLDVDVFSIKQDVTESSSEWTNILFLTLKYQRHLKPVSSSERRRITR